MTGRMHWEQQNKLVKNRASNSRELKPIPADADFWRLWNEDKKAMRASGYRVVKTATGWQAFLEVGGHFDE
jgi:hypothetical protein